MTSLGRQGLLVLFLYVLADQMGLPLPAIPVLLAMGALAGAGHFSLGAALLLAVAACLAADGVWYWLGRRHGARVLNLLCRISLEPDSCVRDAENALAAHGARSLLVAKFVPGLSTVAPPVAGLIQMRPSRFLFWDGAGALLWVGAYLGFGWLFSEQIERVLAAVTTGGRFFALAAAALVGYLAWKYVQRERFLRQIQVDRISPDELRRRLDAGEDVVVVDLRHAAEFEAAEATLPGALRVAPEELDGQLGAIPPGREVVLFCT